MDILRNPFLMVLFFNRYLQNFIYTIDSFYFFDSNNASITLEQKEISYPNYREEIFMDYFDAERERYIDANSGHLYIFDFQ